MANKELSHSEFLTTVEFYWALRNMSDKVFAGQNVDKRQAMSAILSMLGYVLIDGKHVDKEVYAKSHYRFGGRPELVDTLEADYDAAVIARAGSSKETPDEVTDDDTRGPETDSSEPTKSSALRKALFREDV